MRMMATPSILGLLLLLLRLAVVLILVLILRHRDPFAILHEMRFAIMADRLFFHVLDTTQGPF